MSFIFSSKVTQKKDRKIHIIGAGISGLIAAKVLEEAGYFPIIIESSEEVGGRIKTKIHDGYQLDVGFQVLLTEYPQALKHLNYEDLKLQKLLPGACIFKNKQQIIIGNPIRNISFLMPTLFSDIINYSDRYKIIKLYLYIRLKSFDKIFKSDEISTIEYLENYGFSKKIINYFFKPFFSGVFLETKLETSSRMFEFVFKMFAKGHVAIPQFGIQEIPNQIANKLTKTTFKFNTKVEKVNEGEIILEDKSIIESDFTIIASEIKNLFNDFEYSPIKWKGCINFYFETEKKSISNALIGLVPEKNTVINNLFYFSSIFSKSKGCKELLSVTVIDSKKYTNEALTQQVINELKEHCNINVIRLIKQFNIPKSLPNLKGLSYKKDFSKFQLSKSIFLAGDSLLNGSLNAAMISGEMSAIQLTKVDNFNMSK